MLAITIETLSLVIALALVLALLIVLIFALAFYRLAFRKEEREDRITEVEETEVLPKYEAPARFSIADITDEDMMVAALIATIDYAGASGKDVRLLSIRQIG
ncbi:MAG: hypothetical protein PHX62_00315 [Bacilli bacterium]|nr:hypothetical protein [Bacilli bacterium]